MQIIVTRADQDKITINTTFKEEETSHELFTTTTDNIINQHNVVESNIPSIQMDNNSKPVQIKPEPTPTPIEPIPPSNIIIEQELTSDDDVMQVLGNIVDGIREQYCGDVTQTYNDGLKNTENNPIPDEKDLSNCPCFVIGSIEEPIITVEPEPETITNEDLKNPWQ